jgi:hypothetical protein
MAFQLRNLVLSAALAVPTLSLFAGAASASGINRVLAANGLVRTDCAPNVVEIRLNLEKSVCAVPTAQYPAGSYYFNEQGFAITRVGSSTAVSQPTQQPSTTTVVVQQAPASNLPYGYVQPVAPVGPAILNVSNPSYPISDVLAAQISASLASRGLTPAACNVNPGVTVVISGQYLACAYPTPQYPAGRYALN